ncbi:MAG: conserved membrane protein of unknown function [Promethearchaeota archaeon]|nr:MAG: conserved membrane protein of unknown function [Candidatus Lokiarchaeota archaeon]
MELELLEFLQGFFSLIFVIISIIIGMIILFKYIKFSKWELLVVGVAWSLMASGYYPDGINFILILFFDRTLSPPVYLLLATSFMVPALYLWTIFISDVFNLKHRKVILIILLIVSSIVESILFTLFIIDTNLVGTLINPFTADFSIFTQILIFSGLIGFVVLGFFFTKESLRTDDPEIKLKGKFLFVAFLSFMIGIILDVLLPLTPLTVVITRVILVSSSIEFYIGYILPDFIKKLLLKD